MRRSREIARRRQLIEAFVDSYEDLVASHQEVENVGFGTTMWVPKRGRDAKIRHLRKAVARASGPAGWAAERSGLSVHLPAIGAINPITNWSRTFEDLPPITPSQTLEFCDSVLGRLDAEEQAWRARERTPAGLVARFIGFPATVREIAGFKGKPAGRAVFGAAALLQGVLVAIGAALFLHFVFGIG